MVANTKYRMREWLKKDPKYSDVTFKGFFDGSQLLDKCPKKLKDMTSAEAFKFVDEDGVKFDGTMSECALMHSVSKVRITFSEAPSAANNIAAVSTTQAATASTNEDAIAELEEPVTDVTVEDVPEPNVAPHVIEDADEKEDEAESEPAAASNSVEMVEGEEPESDEEPQALSLEEALRKTSAVESDSEDEAKAGEEETPAQRKNRLRREKRQEARVAS